MFAGYKLFNRSYPKLSIYYNIIYLIDSNASRADVKMIELATDKIR